MKQTDLVNTRTFAQLLAPATKTADANSASVNMAGFNALTLVANIGVSGDTLSGSVKIELEVQESSNNSTWTAAANASLSSSVTGTNTGTFALIDDPAEDDTLYTVQYLGTAQYVRVVANLTGTHTNGTPISVTAIQGGERYLP